MKARIVVGVAVALTGAAFAPHPTHEIGATPMKTTVIATTPVQNGTLSHIRVTVADAVYDEVAIIRKRRPGGWGSEVDVLASHCTPAEATSWFAAFATPAA